MLSRLLYGSKWLCGIQVGIRVIIKDQRFPNYKVTLGRHQAGIKEADICSFIYLKQGFSVEQGML